jgi:hypothetical protein
MGRDNGGQSVKKLLSISVILCILALLRAPVMGADEKGDVLGECISCLSKMQAYIEFYYMETGIYPKSLAELERIFNEDVENAKEKLLFPRDPASGKDFIYTTGKDFLSYTLSAPDPSAYGLKKLAVSSVNWGWMNSVAQEKRRMAFAQFCKFNIEFLSQAINKYRSTEKKVPTDLKLLIPKYIKGVPLCPASGREYIYKGGTDSYSITCANPKEHGFKTFIYTSKDGFKAEPIETSEKEVKPEIKENKPFK